MKRCAALVVLIAACSAEVETRPEIPVWSLEQVIVIGSESDPRYTFHRLGSVRSDSRERIHAADRGDNRIRVYGPDGQHLRDIGRAGEGPGEFSGLLSIGFLGDTLYAIDGKLGRITYFDSAGTVLRTEHVQDIAGAPAIAHRVLPSYLLATPMTPPDENPVTSHLLISRSGGTRMPVGRAEPGRGPLHLALGSATLGMPDPFAPTSFLVVNDDGTRWIEVRQHPDAGLPPGSFSLTLREVGGDPIWTREFSTEPIAITDEEVDSVARAIAARYPGLELNRVRDALDAPPLKSPLAGLRFGRENEIWMLSTSGASTGEWTVLDSAGVPVANVRFPDGGGPIAFQGRARVLSTRTDDLGRQQIVIYELKR